MKWHIFECEIQLGIIECCQEIKIKGYAESLYNQYTFLDIQGNSFKVEFENVNLGKIEGKGVVEPDFVGWEFRGLDIDYEGYEYYEKTDGEIYQLRAAYTSSDDLQTEVSGQLRKSQQLITKAYS